MRTKLVQIIFVIFTTLFLAALQDMLPAFGGVKPPLLLAASLFWADSTHVNVDRNERESIIFQQAPWLLPCIFLGACEEDLSAFPIGCSTGFFLLAGFIVKLFRSSTNNFSTILRGILILIVAAPLHEVWLVAWDVTGSDPSLPVRFFASTLPATIAGVLIFTFLPWLQKWAGFKGMRETSGMRETWEDS